MRTYIEGKKIQHSTIKQGCKLLNLGYYYIIRILQSSIAK